MAERTVDDDTGPVTGTYTYTRPCASAYPYSGAYSYASADTYSYTGPDADPGA